MRHSTCALQSLLVGLALLAACGGSGSAADADSGDTGEPFTLEVVNGYGSGVYAAGQVVHVWSTVSTTNEVALPWGGDSSLLNEPSEWHSSFAMPARNVRLVGNTQPLALSLTVESFNGSTSRPKTARYHFPPGMRGVVLFSHGTGGFNTFIEGTEPFALALALVHAGYGIFGTEAEEAVAGDLNGDGKERWFAGPNFRADNVDLRNLELLFASFESRGLIPANTPKFALGMSAGGSFSHFLGTVSARTRTKASLRPAAQANPSESASSGPTITQRPVCNPLRGHEQPPSCAQRPLRTRPLTARPGLFDLHT